MVLKRRRLRVQAVKAFLAIFGPKGAPPKAPPVAVKPGRGSDLNKEANSNPALCGSVVRRISDPESVYLLSYAKHLLVMTDPGRAEDRSRMMLGGTGGVSYLMRPPLTAIST
jgi:hypothetical protein